MFRLDGKIAVVTGGYGHLGTAFTNALAKAGAIVVVAGRSRKKFEEKFDKTFGVDFVSMDVSYGGSIRLAFETVVSKYGKIDLLVNNAFFCSGSKPEDMSVADWLHGIEGTLNSAYTCMHFAIPHMKNNSGGNIINISSMYGVDIPDFGVYNVHKDFFNPPNYGVAKAGIIHMTKYYAKYYAKDNIRINCISPGAFPSKKVQEHKGFIDKLEANIPMGKIGNPDDLKGLMVFMAADAASYITGQNIVIDGGWTL